MLISKTPYRISLFGGGTDYPSWYKINEGEVISASINKYVYISLRVLPNFFDHNYRISYSEIEEVKNIDNIKHKVVRELLKRYHKNREIGLEIHYDGDLPSRSGMGSSSSFVVGMINIFNSFQKKKLSKNTLAEKSIHFEQKILKENVGSQDQIATTFGGFNLIKFKKNDKFSVRQILNSKKKILKFENNLFLVFTGLTRNAHNIAGKYSKNLNIEKYSNMQLIQKITVEAKSILHGGNNFDEIGHLLNEYWKIKKSLNKNITNPRIEGIYSHAISNGAIGGKLLGAGAGGFMLFYVPKKNHKIFLNSMKKNCVIPIKFENKGSQLITNL